jgi:hypothetical protein
MTEKQEPEKPLTPEQEAMVGQFVHQLNAETGEVVKMVITPVGPVRITAEDDAKIRAAAVDKTIELIRQEEKPKPSLTSRVVSVIGGISFGVVVLSSAVYFVYKVIEAISGH